MFPSCQLARRRCLRSSVPLLFILIALTMPLLPARMVAQDSFPDQVSTAEVEQRLLDTPVFYNFVSPQVFAIAQRGQMLNMRAQVFALIGDSNIDNGDYLYPFGVFDLAGCDLGEFADLLATLEYFSATPPLEGMAGAEGRAVNSFVRNSAAVDRGLGSASALDPFWTDDPMCAAGESPLACETRLLRPGVALVVLGQADVNGGMVSVEQYAANMDQIVTALTDQGIVPILTTLVFLPERAEYARAMQYNAVLLDLAAARGLPLLNLWGGLRGLPNSGIGPDRSHLYAVPGEFCRFDGAQDRYGGTRRNLLTLQGLDMLRRYVLTVDMTP